MRNLLAFNTEADYESRKAQGILTPNVSFVRDTNKVHYNPDDPNYFCIDVDELDSDKYLK